MAQMSNLYSHFQHVFMIRMMYDRCLQPFFQGSAEFYLTTMDAGSSDSVKLLIESYFNLGLSYRNIVSTLKLRDNVYVTERHFKRLLQVIKCTVPMHPRLGLHHAYFIVLQGLNCRKNHVNRKDGIHYAYQAFI